MKRKLLISLGLALLLTALFAVGAMAASDKLVLTGYDTVTVGFPSARPSVTLKSTGGAASGVVFSAKPASKVSIDPATGVFIANKACTVTVTAKYTTIDGKVIKGTKSVKAKANKYTGKINKTGWTTATGRLYYTTKRLYYSGNDLCAEMWIHNYYGMRLQLSLTAQERLGAIIDLTTNELVVPVAAYGTKYLSGVRKGSIIGKKGKFGVLFKFPISGYPALGNLDLRSGRYRVVHPYESTNVKLYSGESGGGMFIE